MQIFLRPLFAFFSLLALGKPVLLLLPLLASLFFLLYVLFVCVLFLPVFPLQLVGWQADSQVAAANCPSVLVEALLQQEAAQSCSRAGPREVGPLVGGLLKWLLVEH